MATSPIVGWVRHEWVRKTARGEKSGGMGVRGCTREGREGGSGRG